MPEFLEYWQQFSVMKIYNNWHHYESKNVKKYECVTDRFHWISERKCKVHRQKSTSSQHTYINQVYLCLMW